MNTDTTGLVVLSVRSESQKSEPQAKAIGLPENRTARTVRRNTTSSMVALDDARGATKQDTIDVAVPA